MFQSFTNMIIIKQQFWHNVYTLYMYVHLHMYVWCTCICNGRQNMTKILFLKFLRKLKMEEKVRYGCRSNQIYPDRSVFKEINLADRAPKLVSVESRRPPVTRAAILFPPSIKECDDGTFKLDQWLRGHHCLNKKAFKTGQLIAQKRYIF